jgi:RNA polymerase sigma-70 factor (ECF subfamily)
VTVALEARIVGVVEPVSELSVDQDSQRLLRDLRTEGSEREAAIALLHDLLLRAARFEVARRRPTLPHLRGDELDDIALEAADDALMSVLRRLDDFEGRSRFTTWVYKFALLEAAVKLRKRAWQGREVPLEPESWALFSSPTPGPQAEAEQASSLRPCNGRSARS